MSETALSSATGPPASGDLSTAADELRALAETRVKQFTEALKSQDLKALTDRAVAEASARWKEAGTSAAAFVKESPGRAALAALGIGFALGMLFRRD
jgi:ElaB/YqjD/DUF883 family membrane-anchored ribosome-binding protein